MRSDQETDSSQTDQNGVYIEIVRGQAKSKKRYVTSSVFLIGSAHDCDLVLGDPQFPDVHLYLFVREEQVSVRVLGGAPDVSVNGETIRSTILNDGDRLRMGPYEFRVGIPAPPGPRGKRPAKRALAPTLTPRFAYAADPQGVHAVQRLLADVHAVTEAARTLRLYVEVDCSTLAEFDQRESA